MLFNLFNILKDLLFFTGSYSNNVFPEPLSEEEESEAIENMLNGDIAARNKLIEHNLRLVAHIVKKFDAAGDTDDLISIGTIGLIKGIDSYKNNKKTKITTYAARCIQNEILMYYRSNKNRGNTISLNDSIGYDKEGNEINLIEMIKDKGMDLFEKVNIKNNIILLNEYLKLLNPREKEIIIKRYGLYNTREMTQKEIAKELKISRSYVSRIEKRALTKMLTEFIKNKNID
ncbi:MAG TPA: RNA polymerase sporulation sigma factor SigK [Candidatus Onthocola stercorigallinarum]|jgi:RNA polymerase sporulation-specific sigma factor|nr:RNA polymerase sporulation sigma factor SigK [Candidatus Onthocola stercorigallinarum]